MDGLDSSKWGTPNAFSRVWEPGPARNGVLGILLVAPKRKTHPNPCVDSCEEPKNNASPQKSVTHLHNGCMTRLRQAKCAVGRDTGAE